MLDTVEKTKLPTNERPTVFKPFEMAFCYFCVLNIGNGIKRKFLKSFTSII
jgi:hypothetical protein